MELFAGLRGRAAPFGEEGVALGFAATLGLAKEACVDWVIELDHWPHGGDSWSKRSEKSLGLGKLTRSLMREPLFLAIFCRPWACSLLRRDHLAGVLSSEVRWQGRAMPTEMSGERSGHHRQVPESLVNEMLRRSPRYLLLAVLGLAVPAAAQSPLSLPDAIARARAQNPDAGSSAAAEREAAQRVTQARAGYWPRVDVAESWQRGDQPVFVFSSLLSQRQFTAANFALDALNHPDALDNFRSAVTVEQPVFDRVARANVSMATIGHEMAGATRQVVDHDLAASVTDAYGRVLAAVGARQSADAAAEAARADRELAGNRRDAGLVTDADVLQIDVHLSRTREQQIVAASDERIARARLNQLIGAPLGEVFALDRAPAVTMIDATDLARLELEAVEHRPDLTLAALQEQLARAGQTAARATLLPRVSAQAGWEFNGGAWNSRASSWIVGAVARVNVFNGFADKARLAEASDRAARLALERTKAETAARLDVQAAAARLDAARASEAVGRDAVAHAQESRRIIRDRYEAGLTDVTSLLRSAEAVAQAEAQQVAAQVAILTASAALHRALGRP
jgi:outer membrane protein TolC